MDNFMKWCKIFLSELLHNLFQERIYNIMVMETKIKKIGRFKNIIKKTYTNDKCI